MGSFSDLKISLLIVWFLISIMVLVVLAVPFIIDHKTILRATPECQWRMKHGRECILCGMARSFLLISKGCFAQAYSLNRGSIVLYLIFVANDLAFLMFLLQFTVKRLRLSNR